MKHSDPLWPVLLLTACVLGSGGATEVYARTRDVGAIRIDVVGEATDSDANPDTSDDPDDDAPDDAAPVCEEHAAARASARRGEIDKALELLTQVIQGRPNEVGPRIDLGFWQRRAGKLEDSITTLEQARAVDPRSRAAAFQLAVSRRVAGDADGAEREFRAALELEPGNTRSLLALARILKKRGATAEAVTLIERAASVGSNDERAGALISLGRTQIAAKQWDKALKAFHGAVDRAPADPSIRIAIAKACLQSEQKSLMPEAREQAEKAALLAPDRALFVALLGWVRERSGDREGARAAYQRALQLDSSQVYAERKLLHLDLGQEDLSAARRHAEHLVARYPEVAEHHFLLGLVATREGRLDVARQSYAAAIEREQGKYPEAYFNLGRLEKSAGNLEASIASYQKAIEIQPSYVEAMNNLALALAAKGRRAEARASLDRALAIEPRYAAAWVNLGEMAAADRQMADAKAAFQKAIAVRPKLASALLGLARAHRDSAEGAQAIELYKKLVELQPKQAQAWFELAELLERKNDLRAAAEAAAHAVELEPDREDALFKKADLLAKVGEAAAARAAFEELTERAPGNALGRLGLAELLLRAGDARGCAREAKRVLDSDAAQVRARSLLERCSKS